MNDLPSTQASLFGLIADRLGDRTDHPFLIDPAGAVLTYGDMLARTAQLAQAMAAQSVRPGDRVVVKLEKSPEAILLYLACLRAGYVFLPINPGFKHIETRHILADAAPSLAICAAGGEAEMRAGLGADGSVLSIDALEAEASRQASRFETRQGRADDLAVILYTSGTTGRPKGAMLTHGNIAANGIALRDHWAFTADDVLLHCLPLFHSHGLFVSLSCSLLSSSSVILCPRFDREQVIDLLERSTVFMGVPTMYVRLLGSARLDQARCLTIRLFASGSAPLLPDIFDAFAARTGHQIVERLGMTETAINASNPLDGPRRPGTVGPALPTVELRIVGAAGERLPTDSVGALQVRGPHVFVGYWRQPEQTEAVLSPDGWFDTGDIGKLDRDGYLTLVGRAKDVIISGGYNVYPLEVEAVIDQLDGVMEATIIGLPHPDLGEAVTAVIVADSGNRPSEQAIGEHVKERLANYKVPKRVLFVDELPRNDMGKIQKTKLREFYRELYRSS